MWSGFFLSKIIAKCLVLDVYFAALFITISIGYRYDV